MTDLIELASVGRQNTIIIFLILVYLGVPINQTLVERIVAMVYCTGDTITEFVTISPLFMNKTSVAQVSGTTNQWYITLLWTPTDDQKGPQVSLSLIFVFD